MIGHLLGRLPLHKPTRQNEYLSRTWPSSRSITPFAVLCAGNWWCLTPGDTIRAYRSR